MKKISYVILLILMITFGTVQVNAAGGVTISASSISVEKGNATTFKVTASNSAGTISVSSGDKSIATVDKTTFWIENETVTVKVNALKVGTTTIKIDINVATFDEKVYKEERVIKINVIPKKSNNADLSSITVDGKEISNFNVDTTSYNLINTNASSIEVLVKTVDSKAKVSGIGTINLKDGLNTLEIIVTAENGTKKTYKLNIIKDDGIPKVTLDNLIDTINQTESDTIIVNIKNDNNNITKEMLEKVKESNKKLIINKYVDDKLLYTWEINGEDIKECKDIDTFIEFYSSSDNKINELTDYARYLYFNNNLDTSIFNNILLKIYVGEEYNGNIYGYSYKNDYLSLKYDSLKYEDGVIEINNINEGNYVLMQKRLDNNSVNKEDNDSCIHRIVAIVELVIIILLMISMLLFYIHHKKQIRRY